MFCFFYGSFAIVGWLSGHMAYYIIGRAMWHGRAFRERLRLVENAEGLVGDGGSLAVPVAEMYRRHANKTFYPV